jgi:ribosome-interacting GTPase 1
MQSTAPSHKGAENLRSDIANRLSKMKSKLEKSRSVKGTGKGMRFARDGSATVVLVGLPNSGKSTLLSKITNATPKISDYAFTTKLPEIGIMEYQGTKIQIVELPALVEGSSKGKARGKEILSLIRNGDLIVCCLLGDRETLEYSLDVLIAEMQTSNLVLNKKKPSISINKAGNNGVEIVGETNVIDGADKLFDILKQRYSNIILRVEEKATVSNILEAMDITKAYRKVIGLWLNPTVKESFKYKDIVIYPYSDVNQTKKFIYDNLDLIIVYTRKPGEKDVDNIPVALRKGSTIKDLCNMLHKDFLAKFKFARMWGSGKYPGQQVSLDYPLSSKDIVELYIKS